jgi:hypothetical protein
MLNKFIICFKNTLLLASVLSTVALSSCRDDETEPIDTGLPTVAITPSVISDIVWNTVTLKVEATDNIALKSIELRIDGTSVGTATTSPYEFSWDTQKIADGEHTITGVARDEAGNEKTMEIKLTVRNILLSADIPDDFLQVERESQYQNRGFIFLSDNLGKVIAALEYHNGDHIEIKAPDFNGSEFAVTEAHTWYYDDNLKLNTTEKVGRGTWSLTYAPYYGEDFEFAGDAELNFTNTASGYDYYMHTNWTSWLQNPESNAAKPLILFSPSMLYIHRVDLETGQETYNVIPSITAGNTNAEVDLSLVTKPMTTEIKDVPNAFNYAYVQLMGLRSATNDTEMYYDIASYGSQEDGTIVTRYPADAFPAYYSYTDFRDNSSISGTNRSKKPFDLVPLNATIDVTYADNKLAVAPTGTMDFYTVVLQSENQDWIFCGHKNTTEIIIPEIPQILAGKVDRDQSDSYIWSNAYDYAKIDGYEGLVSFIRASEFGFFNLDESQTTEVKSITNDPYSDGRQSLKGRPKNPLSRHIQKRLASQ